jgi:hypothetical protein
MLAIADELSATRRLDIFRVAMSDHSRQPTLERHERNPAALLQAVATACLCAALAMGSTLPHVFAFAAAGPGGSATRTV